MGAWCDGDDHAEVTGWGFQRSVSIAVFLRPGWITGAILPSAAVRTQRPPIDLRVPAGMITGVKKTIAIGRGIISSRIRG
jgi:hypothetical protein